MCARTVHLGQEQIKIITAAEKPSLLNKSLEHEFLFREKGKFGGKLSPWFEFFKYFLGVDYSISIYSIVYF